MSRIAAALRELIAAGVTGDSLVAAIERIEAAEKPTRTRGAIRTERWRERLKASQSVTVTECDASVSSPAPPSDSSPITPPITPPTPSPSSIARGRVRGARLPADWQPADADLKFASDLGLNRFEIDREIAKFCDYWHARAGPNALKCDWSATWRSWCRKAMDIAGKDNGKRTVQDAAREMVGRLADFGEVPTAVRSGARSSPTRLLPPR